VSTTLTRTRSEQRQSVESLRFVGNGRRRQPLLALASLALVTLCVALFTSIYLHAGSRVSVLAVAHDVPRGQVITSGDLSVVRISSSPGLYPVPVDDARNVVGRTTAVPLLRGTLFSLGDLTRTGRVARGEAIVGVALKSGQLPAQGVADGDTVDVILTGSPTTLTGGASDGTLPTATSATGAQVEIGGILASDATVTGVAVPSASGADPTVVSVLIPSALAPLVASASAAGQAALVLVGSSS